MGIVEGLTEFADLVDRPPDSGGLAARLRRRQGQVFDIAIQTGTIFAVILVYWQKIHATVAALPRQAKAQRLALNILIGFLPAVVLGLLFGKAIKAHLITPAVVATTFILGGFVIRWRTARPSRVMLAVPLERSLLERIRSRRRCLEFRDLASLHRVTPIRLLKPRRVARLACCGEADVGIAAERELLLNPGDPVLPKPTT